MFCLPGLIFPVKREILQTAFCLLTSKRWTGTMISRERCMKKVVAVSLLAFTLVSACSSPEEPKATSSPAPSQSPPSVGHQYGETLKGGIDKAKDIQEKMDDRIQQMDETAKQNKPSLDE
jgi:hypothetical protein